MARISEEKIREIRSKADIAEVIAKYVPITRKGRNYVCVCPFHDDHDPSLSISADKQIFKCFVCGAAGNVFGFVSRFENISYVESIVKVAEMVHVDVSEYDKSESYEKIDPRVSAIHKVNQAAIDYTNYSLKSSLGSSVVDYLHQRGIQDNLIEKFQIGYNPPNDALYRFLHAKKFADKDLVESNVVRLTSSGIHDVFANRIMIPIHDRQGHPIAFTARRFGSDEEAKYINTQETICYIKGNVIFNYHRAKEICRQTKRVLLVEGAMDVIAFEKVGIGDVVATLGTACTKEQIALLKGLHVRVDVCYDGDEAGINAIYKFGILASDMNLEFEVVNNKTGLDPDEIIEKYGREELISLSNKTISWIDFLFEYLQKKYNLENYSQRVEFAKLLQSQIEKVREQFAKEQAYKRLQELTQFDMRTQTQTKKVLQKIVQSSKAGSAAEYEILSEMLLSLQACNRFKEELGFLPHSVCNKLAIYIIDAYRKSNTIEIADLLSAIAEEEVRELLIELSDWDLAPLEYNPKVFKDACTKIKISCIDHEINKLNDLISKISDPLKKGEIGNQIIKKQQEKMELMNHQLIQ